MKLLVLDGNSLLNRAFFGIKLLSTKSGDFTNGIYGFLTMFRKIYDERSEEHTSELQSHCVISYAVFCLKKKK